MSELDTKIKTYSTAFAAVAVPIVVALIGSWFSAAIKQSESEQKFVSLAIEILRDEPVESQIQLRAWATDVVSKYSGVSLENARDDLINNIRLPPSLNTHVTQDSSYFPIEPIDGKGLCGEDNGSLTIFPNQAVRLSDIESSERNKGYRYVVFDYVNYCPVSVNEVSDKILPRNYRRMGTLALVGVGIRISVKFTADGNIPLPNNLGQIGVYADEGKINGTIQLSTIGISGEKVSSVLPMPAEISSSRIQELPSSIDAINEYVFDNEVTISPRIFALVN